MRMKALSFYNIKGGVGKSTSTVNVAYETSRLGFRTLVWDLDPQGAASYILKVKPQLHDSVSKLVAGKRDFDQQIKETHWPLLDIVPSDFALRHLDTILDREKQSSKTLAKMIKSTGKHYDVVILDCAPAASLVSENVINASDVICVPLIPTTLSVRSFESLYDFVKKTRNPEPKIVGVFTMVDRRKHLHKQIMEKYTSSDPRFSKTSIPASTLVEQMASHRGPLSTFAPRSSATLAYTELTSELLNTLLSVK